MTSKNRVIAEWAREARDSSIWFALLLFVILSIVIGTLDVIYWDKNFGRNIIAEANAVLIDIFVIGIVVAFYEYQRRVNRAADDAQKELTVLGTLGGRDSVPRKVELIDLLASNGRKPISLQSYQLRGAKLNGRDLSRVDMRFVVLKESPLVRTVLIGSDLLCADLRESVLVEANMSGANLYEANFGGAWLSRASLTGADVKHANFRGARELTCEQLMSAENWTEAHRDQALACGAAIPTPGKRSLGQQYRELLRRPQDPNPFFPYHLVPVARADGTIETRAVKEGKEVTSSASEATPL